MESKKYSKHLETLIALVTHLAMTKYKSRTPRILAQDLCLDYEEVKLVLTTFKGFFRESQKSHTYPDGIIEHYYWLQIRYALWYVENQQQEDENLTPESPA